MEPLRVALIGAGYWGPNYARVFAEAPGARLTTVCDLREEELAKMRARFPSLRTETDAQRVLQDPGVDAVIVATPAATHAKLGLAALQAGKHLLVEKPLALALADCAALRDAARKAAKTLMVGHIYAYHPAVQRLRDLVRAPETGPLRYLHFQRTALGPVRQDVNVLWDLAPHDLSILLELTGEVPERVACTGASFLRRGVEDVAFATLWLSSGALAQVHVSWLHPVRSRRCVAVGARRTLVFEDAEPTEKLRIVARGAELDAAGQVRMPDGAATSVPLPAQEEPLRVQVAHFVRCAREGKAPRTGGDAGARVVAVLEALERALRQGTHEKVERLG